MLIAGTLPLFLCDLGGGFLPVQHTLTAMDFPSKNYSKEGNAMLQIIGLLGCVYLFVKAFDILGSANHRKASGSLNGFALTAVIIAFLGAILFAFILVGLGTAPSPYQP